MLMMLPHEAHQIHQRLTNPSPTLCLANYEFAP
jgi:hypothetical protein